MSSFFLPRFEEEYAFMLLSIRNHVRNCAHSPSSSLLSTSFPGPTSQVFWSSTYEAGPWNQVALLFLLHTKSIQ